MRENRLSGSEGGATLIRRPYPYLSLESLWDKSARGNSTGRLKLTLMGLRPRLS
jgi:hypothetical protein